MRWACQSLRSRTSSLLLAGLIVAALVSCEPAAEPDGAGPAQETPSPTPFPPPRGGSVTFGVIGEPATMDPYSPVASDLTFELLRPVYPTLYRVTPDGTAMPDLAQSWNPTSQGVEVRLRSRQWSDGEPITAQDVADSYARAGGAGQLLGSATQSRVALPTVRVRDAHTLLFSGSGLSKQSFGSPLFVLPGGRLNLTVSGGPYKVGSRTPGLQVVYVRNRTWTGEPPLLDRVAVRFIEDLDTMIALLQKKELDAASPPSAVNLAERLEADGLAQTSRLGWEAIALDLHQADQDSRGSVESSIDRPELKSGLIRSDGRIANTLFPAPGPEGANGSWQLPEGAASTPASYSQLAIGKGDELTEQMQEVIQLELQRHGSDAELVTADARTFYGEWRLDAPTDFSLVRYLGSSGAARAAENRAFADATAMPLFQVRTYATWRPGAVQGVVPNPSIEGPLWNMQGWAQV